MAETYPGRTGDSRPAAGSAAPVGDGAQAAPEITPAPGVGLSFFEPLDHFELGSSSDPAGSGSGFRQQPLSFGPRITLEFQKHYWFPRHLSSPPEELEVVTSELEIIAQRLGLDGDDDEGFLPSMPTGRKSSAKRSHSLATAHALNRTHEVLLRLSRALVALRDMERKKYEGWTISQESSPQRLRLPTGTEDSPKR